MKRRNSQLTKQYTYAGDGKVETRFGLSLFGDRIPFCTRVYNQVDDLLQALEAKGDAACWISVTGLKAMEEIKPLFQYFRLNLLHVKDIYNADHLPKIEEYSDYVFAILNTLTRSASRYETDNVSVVLGTNFVLSFQDFDRPLFDNVIRALQDQTEVETADQLFCFLLNNITGDFMNEAEMVSDSLHELETQILHFAPTATMAKKLQEAQSMLIQLGKSTFLIQDKVARLLQHNNPFLRPQNYLYFQDLVDHINYVAQQIRDSREILRSLEDLYIAGNDLHMNKIMQRLTIISTIFIPLTFLAGVWGMNFSDMPELHWRYGYLFAWGILLLVGLFTTWLLKHNKWF